MSSKSNYGSELILFFSIDIIGSTDFKSKNPPKEEFHWMEFFLEFFNTFKYYIQDEIDKLKIKYAHTLKNIKGNIKLWKMIGDELIFTKNIYEDYEIPFYVTAFIQAMNEFRKYIHSKNSLLDLDLKSTLWVAGFPIMNQKISKIDKSNNVQDQNENSNEITIDPFDYLGPSIDIGFRLTKLSTYNKCFISLELAYILNNVNNKILKDNQIQIFFNGEIELKGVFKGRHYPKFYLYINNEKIVDNNENEIRILEIKKKLLNIKPCNRKDINNYCKAIYKIIGNSHLFIKPYIVNCNNSYLNKIDPTHKKIIKIKNRQNNNNIEYSKLNEKYYEHMKKIIGDKF